MDGQEYCMQEYDGCRPLTSLSEGGRDMLVRENIVTVAFGLISTGDGVRDRNQGDHRGLFFWHTKSIYIDNTV